MNIGKGVPAFVVGDLVFTYTKGSAHVGYICGPYSISGLQLKFNTTRQRNTFSYTAQSLFVDNSTFTLDPEEATISKDLITLIAAYQKDIRSKCLSGLGLTDAQLDELLFGKNNQPPPQQQPLTRKIDL